jgi:hypothetical protein
MEVMGQIDIYSYCTIYHTQSVVVLIGRYTQIRLLQWMLQCPRRPDYVATNMSEQLHELGTYEYDIMSTSAVCGASPWFTKYKCS